MGDNERGGRRYSDDKDQDYYYSRTVERYDTNDEPTRQHRRNKSTSGELIRYNDDDEIYYSRRESSSDPRRHHHHHHHHHNRSRSRSRSRSRNQDRALIAYDSSHNRHHHHHHHRPRSLSPSAYLHSRNHDWDDEHVTYHVKKKPEHSKAKDAAATILGAIVGGNVGKRVGDGGFVSTAAGALVGAWAGHDLEKIYERRREKGRDR